MLRYAQRAMLMACKRCAHVRDGACQSAARVREGGAVNRCFRMARHIACIIDIDDDTRRRGAGATARSARYSDK